MNTIDCIEKCSNDVKSFEPCKTNCCVTTNHKIHTCDCLKDCLDSADIVHSCMSPCARDVQYAAEIKQLCGVMCNDYTMDCQPNPTAAMQACANTCQACC